MVMLLFSYAIGCVKQLLLKVKKKFRTRETLRHLLQSSVIRIVTHTNPPPLTTIQAWPLPVAMYTARAEFPNQKKELKHKRCL
jgi:hypothetical protein